MYILDACQIIELETTSLIFPFSTCALSTLKASNSDIFCNIGRNDKRFGSCV